MFSNRRDMKTKHKQKTNIEHEHFDFMNDLWNLKDGCENGIYVTSFYVILNNEHTCFRSTKNKTKT